MRNLITIIILSHLFISCNTRHKKESKKENIFVLSETKWECKIADGCINFYKFKSDSSFVFYSCEMEDEYFGDYYFRNDTLFLDQKGSIYDKDLSKKSTERTERKLYELVIKDDKLKHLFMSNWIDDKWVKSDFKFNEAYSYKKVD